MTEGFDRTLHRVAEPRYFEDLAIGERFFIPSRTVTEAHFSAFQTISADNHPIHYDLEYCRERGHKGPLAHGFQILCFTAAGASTFAHQIGDGLIAFVEQSSKFLKPVYAGDTLYPMLEIAALTPQRSTGVVTLRVSVHNQRGEPILSGEQKILLRKRPRPDPFLPELREKNRFDAGNRRSDRQQPAPNQALRKPTPDAVRECSEGGRPASEGASREGMT